MDINIGMTTSGIRKLHADLGAVATMIVLTGCSSKASVAARNLSTDADNFKIARVITFYDTQTGAEPLIIKGLCSLGSAEDSTTPPDNGGVLEVTCETSPGKFIKDFLQTNREFTFFVSQVAGATVSDTHYQYILRPGTIIPSVSVQ